MQDSSNFKFPPLSPRWFTKYIDAITKGVGAMLTNFHRDSVLRSALFVLGLFAATLIAGAQQQPAPKFHLEEASIADIQQAILSKQITTVGVVELYLRRIKAYNNTCVNEPQGI